MLSISLERSIAWNDIVFPGKKVKPMFSREQVKQFTITLLELHRDNFIQLLSNPDFQKNDIEKKETAVRHITTLFRKELEQSIDSFIKLHPN